MPRYLSNINPVIRQGDDITGRDLTSDTVTTGAITCTTIDTGQGANEVYDMDQNVLTTSNVTFATVNTGQGANEVYGMDQDVKTTSNVTFATVNTGQGANELYDMDQNVTTSSDVQFGAVICTTLNTGQGANELYGMDQDVKTTSNVTFDTVGVTGTLTCGLITTGLGTTEVYQMNQNIRTTDKPTFTNARFSDWAATDLYASGSTSSYLKHGSTNGTTATLYITRFGRMVTIYWPNLAITTGGTTTADITLNDTTFGASLGAPPTLFNFWYFGSVAGSGKERWVSLSTGGLLTFKRDTTGSTWPTSTSIDIWSGVIHFFIT